MLVGRTTKETPLVVARESMAVVEETTQDFGIPCGSWMKMEWNENAIHDMEWMWEDPGITQSDEHVTNVAMKSMLHLKAIWY